MSLSITNISKTYANGVQALNNVTLSIPTGMYGLLGPNGAGKSSLMRTIATLQDADSGHISFENLDVLKNKEDLRKTLGYLPQEFGVYPKISAEELLDYLATLKGISDKSERKKLIASLLELTNLTAVKKRAVATYSGGMKQRFGIAQALIGNPKLIIVDEPTAGLDPEERLRFYNILSEIGSNVTIILSTHIVSDVSDLCQNFAIINQGKVLAQTTPQLAQASIQGKIWQRLIEKSELESIENQFSVIASRFTMGKLLVKIYGENRPGGGFDLSDPQLEDFYFSHIKGFIQ
jgi:ABC-2 type transport system ATP-binding protein